MAVVDLNITHVPDRTQVWRLYPGQSRNFSETFRRTGTVFLDTPGLVLGTETLNNRRQLNAQIARTWDLREWHHAPASRRGTYPGELQDYLDTINSRSTGQQHGNIKKLYYDAAPGDIVVVPVGEGFEAVIMIGELVGNFSSDDHEIISFYGNDAVPFRRVRWINPEQKRRELTPFLVHHLAGRRAIRPVAMELDQNATDIIHAEIFAAAYHNFMFKDYCEYVFDAPDYTNKPLDIFPGAEVISALIGFANMVADGETDAVGSHTVRSAALSDFASEGVEAFEVEFASPGSYLVKMRGRVPALLAAVVITACLSTEMSAQEIRGVQIENPTPLPPGVAEATKRLVENVIDATSSQQIDELAATEKLAREKIGLQHKSKARRR